MKKIIIYTLCAFLGLQACKKDTALIDDTLPEERVAQSLEAYRTALTTAPNGWKGILKTSQVGGAYSFYFEFGTNDRVKMLADYDEDTAVDVFESTYRLKQVMAPTLIFDTYSYIHLLSDPDPAVFGGNTGAGFGSDFEFEFRELKGDTIKLIGKKRNTEFVLVKATVQEKTLYTSGGFGTLISNFNNFLVGKNFLYVEDPQDPSKKIQVSFKTDVSQKAISLIYSDASGAVQTTSDVFAFLPTGLVFDSGLTYKTLTITSIYLDSATGKLMARLSNGNPIEIKNSATPIYPLHLLLGTAYTSIVVPNATTYPGWTADFIARLTAVSTSVKTFSVSGAQLNLVDMAFDFNSSAKTLEVVATTKYANSFLYLTYLYTYTKTPAGVYKFTFVGSLDANSNALRNSFAPLLTQRLDINQFTLDYFTHTTTGASLGQFKSVENPNFTFTGTLQ